MNESRFSGNASEEEEEESRLYHLSIAFRFAMLAKYYPIAYHMNRIFPFFVYAVGFVGNSISAVLWFQRRLSKNNSSAFYLALTLINHLLFLALNCVDHLDMIFHWNLIGRCYLCCEVYFYLLNFARYMLPLLVLAFAGERFVAICYPLHRRLLCRTRTARTYATIGGIVVALLCVAHPVFWTTVPDKEYCGYRDIPGLKTAWRIFSSVTEVFFFVAVPLVVVVFDLIVVLALCRIRRNAMRMRMDRENLALQKLSGEKQIKGEGGDQGPKEGDRGSKKEEEETQRPRQELAIRVPAQATTAFILTVSMYEAVCMMAESTVYLLLDSYPAGEARLTEAEIVKDPTWVSHFRYSAAQCIVYALTLTRHGCLILLFLAIAARYRRALCDLLRCQAASPLATERTGNSWLSSSTCTAGSRSRLTKEQCLF